MAMPVATHGITYRDGEIDWDISEVFGPDFWSIAQCWAVFQHTSVTFAFLARTWYAAGELELVVHTSGQRHTVGTWSLPYGKPSRIQRVQFPIDGTQFLDYSGRSSWSYWRVRTETHQKQSSKVSLLYSHGTGTVSQAEKFV
ncbi:hypothetical protein [Nocardiopsis rhodophaea]